MPNLSELTTDELQAEIARRKQSGVESITLPKKLSDTCVQNLDVIRSWKSRAFDDIEKSIESLLTKFIERRISEHDLEDELFIAVVHNVYGDAGLKFLDKLRKRYDY